MTLSMNKGVLYAIGAYGLWGLLPVYLKSVDSVPEFQILIHRVLWSFLFLAAILLWKKDWARPWRAIKNRKTFLYFSLAAVLMGINWLVYIYGVNNDYIVETSLGYFINPLVSVLLGVIFLREHLRPLQWLPIGLATVGVLYLTVNYGTFPWIALALAGSFGLYGLFQKKAPLGALHTLSIETAVLFLPAILMLLFFQSQGTNALGHQGLRIDLLLMMAGLVTALPLLLFSTAAQMINLSMLGILQYLAPTLQFLLGVLVYGEPFTHTRLIGFSIIWVALIIYVMEGLLDRRASQYSPAS